MDVQIAEREISEQLGIERWVDFRDSEVCDGCLFLMGRHFFAFQGPSPPIHAGCRGGRMPVETEGLSGVALIRLVLEARANGRAARFLEEEARRQSTDHRVDRIVNELAERDPQFERVRQERRRARQRRNRRRGGQ